MMRDLENRKDLELLLNRFYELAFEDPLIGIFFTEIVPLDLKTHIPVITDFWESVIFNTHGYRKNVMEVHAHIHHLKAIQKEHLDRWVELFTSTVDELYTGLNANRLKQRAISIATLMDIKLNQNQIGKL
jgi:hemoglobin